jgi:hypothetical protein
MPFFFTAAHYWVAWLAIGGLLAHLGVKLPVIRTALRHPSNEAPPPAGPPRNEAPGLAGPLHNGAPRPAGGLSRRGLLGGVGAAAGLITIATVGQTVAPLAPVSLLAPRRPATGPQRLPVNRSAAAAGVRAAALDPAYRLLLAGPTARIVLSLADLRALPQHTAVLPIACVEGWSATGAWTGVRLRDLAAMVGTEPGRAVVESLEAGGRYRTSMVAGPHLRDPLTLVALGLNGAPLDLDHGYPARLIAPNRPGVLQTKWLARITIGAGR